MAFSVRRTEYFNATLSGEPGEAYEVLSQLAGLGINLLAFTGMPVGLMRTQMTLFPEDGSKIVDAARKAGWALDGPHPALLVQGDDELGALARIHGRLKEAGVNVFASTGVADGKGSFGYVLYLRSEEFERAAKAMGL
jgi:hypothetical protein